LTDKPTQQQVETYRTTNAWIYSNKSLGWRERPRDVPWHSGMWV